jgi:tetratricopeptide (TPR) repeat protein
MERRARPDGRRVATAVVLALLAFAAWRATTLGLADHWSRGAPDRALGWRHDHPGALVADAERRQKQAPTDPRIAEQARRALAANPLEGRAYRVLGMQAAARGDAAAAERLLALAALRWPRDLPVHGWLQHHYLLRGEVDRALRHADLVLRVEPEASRQQFPFLLQLAAIAPAQPALARLLGTRPPWRTAFLLELSRTLKDTRAVAPLIAAVRRQPGGMTPVELSVWLDHLAGERRWEEAYLTWAQSLPAARRNRLGNVYNGGFEFAPVDGGFDWRIGEVPGATIDRVGTAGATGERALRIAFDDQRVAFDHLRQLLALPPGAYRLEGRAKADGLRTPRGLVWEVLCADSGNVLAASEPVSGVTPWRAFAVDFEVPAGRCGGQWLRLHLPARIPAERQIGGTVWFDDVAIRAR